MEGSSLYQGRYEKGNLTLCKYQSQCVVTENILLWDPRKTVSITDKNKFNPGYELIALHLYMYIFVYDFKSANLSLNLVTMNLIYLYIFTSFPFRSTCVVSSIIHRWSCKLIVSQAGGQRVVATAGTGIYAKLETYAAWVRNQATTVINRRYFLRDLIRYIVKPAHVITSIKQ